MCSWWGEVTALSCESDDGVTCATGSVRDSPLYVDTGFREFIRPALVLWDSNDGEAFNKCLMRQRSCGVAGHETRKIREGTFCTWKSRWVLLRSRTDASNLSQCRTLRRQADETAKNISNQRELYLLWRFESLKQTFCRLAGVQETEQD